MYASLDLYSSSYSAQQCELDFVHKPFVFTIFSYGDAITNLKNTRAAFASEIVIQNYTEFISGKFLNI